ncbi:7384_t:CDS:1, partial [Gigaspora rosea]
SCRPLFAKEELLRNILETFVDACRIGKSAKYYIFYLSKPSQLADFYK